VDESRPGRGIFWHFLAKAGQKMAWRARNGQYLAKNGRKWQNGTVWDRLFAGAKFPEPGQPRSYEK
jgi:hypothetical protein